jgi:hypothetical protein
MGFGSRFEVSYKKTDILGLGVTFLAETIKQMLFCCFSAFVGSARVALSSFIVKKIGYILLVMVYVPSCMGQHY